eukprot:TRINITY_DN31_c0_g1_i1.p2 TRINITY_DN31_c0_g1~~TRINITY_DN31_c0_g1_i1.p2  ORF type:complete len:100 (+),score=13.55 TRINITY_DN31_c0_g1_i1:427-726(+)
MNNLGLRRYHLLNSLCKLLWMLSEKGGIPQGMLVVECGGKETRRLTSSSRKRARETFFLLKGFCFVNHSPKDFSNAETCIQMELAYECFQAWGWLVWPF